MTVLDVRLYGSLAANEKPAGIPDVWPAKVIERPDGAGVTAGHQRMTVAEYDAYLATHQATYNTWRTTVKAAADAADALATQRGQARDFIQNDPRPEMKALRALALVVLDEINLVRQNPAAVLAPRTAGQLLTAMVGKVTDGSAD